MPNNGKDTIGKTRIALDDKGLVLGKGDEQIGYRDNGQMQSLGIFYFGVGMIFDIGQGGDDEIYFLTGRNNFLQRPDQDTALLKFCRQFGSTTRTRNRQTFLLHGISHTRQKVITISNNMNIIYHKFMFYRRMRQRA